MYIPYGIDFKTIEAIQNRKRRRIKRIFVKIRKIFRK
jgi:hypothetical protein